MRDVRCPGCGRTIDLPAGAPAATGLRCPPHDTHFALADAVLPACRPVSVRRSRPPLGLLAGLGVAALALLLPLVAFRSGGPGRAPAAQQAGAKALSAVAGVVAPGRAASATLVPWPAAAPALAADWSHRDLEEQLRRRGVRFTPTHTGKGPPPGLAMYFLREGDAGRKRALDTAPLCAPSWWQGAAYVRKCPSARAARDEAATLRGLWNEQRSREDGSAGGAALGANPGSPGPAPPVTDVVGESAFSWGPFLFVGDPAFLGDIRRALP